jgi:signal transduction histidine kinase
VARDNWQNFAADRDESELSFVYDSLQVKPLPNEDLPQAMAYSQPLIVSGETIGQLAVGGVQNVSPETVSMMSAIAAQASIHLETLRLNEELVKRARELKELDRLKSAFLANMSHELRTPLNSILGFTDVMLEGLDGNLTAYMDNDLRLIQKNGQHLLHLINDVLDMAKIESGRMNLNPEKFKVHHVLDEAVSITSTLASEKNLSLFIDENSDQAIEIFADNTRLRQVMINLVNNSIKFTEKGKIVLSAKPMDGARVLIAVKDTGLGIPPDKLEAIFLEFTQVDTSTTRKVGGTGLGLPISRRLVEMHGGRLWAESSGVDGEGSTFYAELPVEARITEVIEKQEK